MKNLALVFTNEYLNNFPDMTDSSIPVMLNIIITINGVEKLLKDLNVNKASGPDDIPAKILHECASTLASVLTKIFQKSLDMGSLPTAWLDAVHNTAV